MNRIKDKINEIEKYLVELENILPQDFEQYFEDYEKIAACERYFEKIVESLVDLAQLIIKVENFPQPTEDIQTFDILFDKKIISDELKINLKNAKGMRNILAHEYGKVDNELIFESVTQEIIKDAEKFIKKVKENILIENDT